MAEPVLVVDFGTSTSAAIGLTDQATLIREPHSGLFTWPSTVYADANGLLVGTPAEQRKRTDPAAYRSEYKRDLGDNLEIPLGDRRFRAVDLVTATLAALSDAAVRQTGSRPTHTVLTIPASYPVGDP